MSVAMQTGHNDSADGDAAGVRYLPVDHDIGRILILVWSSATIYNTSLLAALGPFVCKW